MKKHYKNLNAAMFHLRYIHAGEVKYSFDGHDHLADNITELLDSSMSTLLCKMYVENMAPQSCKVPFSRSMAELYENIENREGRFARDIVVLEYLEGSLAALETTLDCLLDPVCSKQKGKRGRKGQNKRRNRKSKTETEQP